MSVAGEEQERKKLKERLGAGARYDSIAAPARDLLWARRGTAYFARKLNELSDADLDAPSRVTGWSRRHVVARVGYHARHLARLVEAARRGVFVEMLQEPESQNENIEFGCTLPPHALRYLFEHSKVHLNVEWRDLEEAGWAGDIRTLNGDMVPVKRTPWLRAREIWLCAIDLDNGGTLADVPRDLLEAIRADL
ncbi:maleylpyruvate isomerase N-terminal domain-containing protein (plasmid) [Agrobacterium leguminum]|uniref:maleylpyruvate isomerase N-terminal domain-containing protein n=1 Tax=Agrobacterium leguminum TaxID=2792015 RepID=UPI00272BDDD2|nr:maleylpyruvate isomerase N-terminal domain-containing protein [Agrobacterium leguminum]WLE00564.1 maleylpyruvate isomerase N-terminal domain-containing protein [Agrobacterium leguminum]